MHCNKNQQGFTLLELILVLFLMALIAGLATPFLSSTLERIQLQSSARQIASALRYARSEAITQKTIFSFKGDISTGKYWLTNWTEDQTTKTKTLESGLKMVHITNTEEKFLDGVFSINFFPRGNSSGGTIQLEEENDKEGSYYAITIDPITGTSRIIREAQ